MNNVLTGSRIINPENIRDLSTILLDQNGKLRIVPADVLDATTIEERALFGVRQAVYGFLTTELINYLQEQIAGKSAIEIGSGNGRLSEALGITATDSRMQEEPSIAAYYRMLRQPTIKYGNNVEKLDAAQAVAKYKPEVVLASWVTHRYDQNRSEAGGNQDGVIEEEIISSCSTYIFIGNERVHAPKSIWSLPHEKITPPWLYSRASNGSKNFIAIWRDRGRSN